MTVEPASSARRASSSSPDLKVRPMATASSADSDRVSCSLASESAISITRGVRTASSSVRSTAAVSVLRPPIAKLSTVSARSGSVSRSSSLWAHP